MSSGTLQGWMRRLGAVGAAASFLLAAGPGRCEPPKAGAYDRQVVEALIEAMNAKGVLSDEEAAQLQEKLRKGAKPVIEVVPGGNAAKGEPASAAVAQAGEKPKTEVAQGAVRWGLDLRTRYQWDFFDSGNGLQASPSEYPKLMNTTEDRQRLSLRFRAGLEAAVARDLALAARLATGSTRNPVSTNSALGDGLNGKSIVLDRAFFKWSPPSGLVFQGGRMPNPWFCSDLVWDSDLNFDGVAVLLEGKPFETLGVFATAGAISVQEVEFSKKDKWLYAGQVGVDWRPGAAVAAKLGVAYYDYENITGKPNPADDPTQYDYTLPASLQKGNTLFDIDPGSGIKPALAAKYKELNVTATIDVGVFDPVHITLLGDYVRNLGFKSGEVEENLGEAVGKPVDGYQVGLTVGYPKLRAAGDWRVFGFYKYLEGDAVLDAYTDSDFRLGGTNAKGWIVGGELGVAKSSWLGLRWLSADEISGLPLAVDTVQVDFTASF